MNTNIQEDFEICISLPLRITENTGGSKTAASSKMERFAAIVHGFQPLTIITKRSILDVAAVIVHGFQPLTIITKRSILDVAAVLDPPLESLIEKM